MAGGTSNGVAAGETGAGGDNTSGSLAGAAGSTDLAGAPNTGGAGGEPPLAGTGGGGGTVAGSGGTAAGGGGNAACTGFIDLWRVRQSERAPGEISPPVGAAAPCFECISAAAQSCELPADGACAGGYACVERHCLCTPDANLGQPCLVDDYAADACDCADGCYPTDNANRKCRSRWQLYVACVVETCASQCGQ